MPQDYSILDPALEKAFDTAEKTGRESRKDAAPPGPEPKTAKGPEEETLSQAEIADAIAQAVADAFSQDDPAAERPPEEKPAGQPRPAGNGSQKAPNAQRPKPAGQARAEERKPQTARRPGPSGPATDAEKPRKDSNQTQAAAERGGKRANEKPAAPSRPEPPKPGTQTVKIEKNKNNRISASPLEYIGAMISDIRRRQTAALPPMGTSLRKREKTLSAMTRVDRILAVPRYIILVLMIFCLAGRKYSWMSLGFMSGIGGTYTALLLTILCFFLCWQSTLRALRDLWYLRFSYETLLLTATVLTMAEALMTKNAESLLPLLTMAWCLSGTAEMENSQGDLRFLRGVITGRSRKGIRTARGKWEHTDCIGKAPASTAGFVRRQAQPDVFHSGYSVLSLIYFVLCLVISAYLSGRTRQNYLTVLVTLLDVGVPVSLALCCARPYALLSRKLSGQGAVAGWYGIRGLSGKKAVLIYDDDLFPQETKQHKGVRVLGNMSPQLLVSYGASMVLRANIGLNTVFTQLLRDTGGEIFSVSRFQTQECGLEGYIQKNLVQVGSLQYMQLMGFTLPRRAPKNGVYIAVDGRLEGIFAVTYQVRQGSAAGFRRLVREPRLTPLLATRNFCVNPAFVEQWFHAPVSALACPKAETRRQLSEPSLLSQGAVCGYVLREGVGPYSATVTGARRVYRTGLVFTLLSVLLSCFLTVRTIIALAGGGALMTGQGLLLLQMILLAAVEAGSRVAVGR